MMVPDVYTPEIETEDCPQTDNPSPLAWLLNLSRKQQLFGAIAVVSVGWIAFGGKGEVISKVQNAFTPKINPQSVAAANDVNEASFYLQVTRLQSGLLQSQAQHFHGMAVNFQNEAGHFCAGLSLESCLRSFQESREKQMLALELSQDVGTNNKNSQLQSLLFEITAIEVAIAGVDADKDPVKEQFLTTIIPDKSVTTPPTVQFVQAFQAHRQKEQLQQIRDREMVETQLSNQKLQDCRETGGDCL